MPFWPFNFSLFYFLQNKCTKQSRISIKSIEFTSKIISTRKSILHYKGSRNRGLYGLSVVAFSDFLSRSLLTINVAVSALWPLRM